MANDTEDTGADASAQDTGEAPPSARAKAPASSSAGPSGAGLSSAGPSGAGPDAPTAEAHAEGVDATGAVDDSERRAKEELLEAVDHFRNAASLLFGRAARDPSVKQATKEVRRVVGRVSDAAEPLAKELGQELGRFTKDVMRAVDETTKRARGRGADEEE